MLAKYLCHRLGRSLTSNTTVAATSVEKYTVGIYQIVLYAASKSREGVRQAMSDQLSVKAQIVFANTESQGWNINGNMQDPKEGECKHSGNCFCNSRPVDEIKICFGQSSFQDSDTKKLDRDRDYIPYNV